MPQTALLLGSGFVATPTVDDLSNAGLHLTIACRTLASAKELAGGFPNTKAVSLDVNDTAALEAAVAQHDVTISLIPYTYHAAVIKAAIKAKKHVVTTSYISPAMQALHEEAKAAGITVMNEIGVDPGIDHLSAMDIIDRVHKEGGLIRRFESFCGGLPTPENSRNPLGYKFSWSSRGVLLALKNSARYLEDGKVVDVKSEDLMRTAKPYTTEFLGYSFMCYPNRDSTPYAKRIPEARSVIRGTLRYTGFPAFIQVLVDVGYFREEQVDYLTEPIAWKEATKSITNARSSSESDLLSAIWSKTVCDNPQEKTRLEAGLRWLGVLSDTTIVPKGNPLDTLCATLEEKMTYQKGERDMLFLQHRFETENKDGSKDIILSTLCETGAPVGSGYSAMAKLVGIPCAVAVKQVLNGTISERGILAPMEPKIYKPLIQELKEKYGIECKETRTRIV